MTHKSHFSVVFVNCRRAVTVRCFFSSLENILPFEKRVKITTVAGGLVLRVVMRSAISSLLRRQFGPMWTEDALYCERSVLVQNRYLGACIRYHL